MINTIDSSNNSFLYFPLYKGWVFESKPFFSNPFHALCWQYWNISRDGINYFWVDTEKTPKWHCCIGMVQIDDVGKLQQYHKSSLWKQMLNRFFSKSEIWSIPKNVNLIFKIFISNRKTFEKCKDYFTLPDYQRSIRSTIKFGSVCGSVDDECWSELRNKNGIPMTCGENDILDIGYVVKYNIKKKKRTPGKFSVCNLYLLIL